MIINQKIINKSLEEGNEYSNNVFLNERKHKYLNKKRYRNNNPDDSD